MVAAHRQAKTTNLMAILAVVLEANDELGALEVERGDQACAGVGRADGGQPAGVDVVAVLVRHQDRVEALDHIEARRVDAGVEQQPRGAGVDQDGFLGFVNAGAEASMVGAIADWFAVTALFRHPLGLPIPHTALVPRKKDEFGKSLEEFFAENFLHEQVIRERLAAADIPRRIGEWLTDAANARRVVAESATVMAIGLRKLRDQHVRSMVEDVLIPRFKAEPISPVAGGLLGLLLGVIAVLFLAGSAEFFEERLALAFLILGLGMLGTAGILLGDEVFTPDSSRFWPADTWSPGRAQPSFDKQYVRDWAAGTGWDKNPPAPAIPDEIVAATRERYVTAYETLAGEPFSAWLERTAP